MDEFDQYLHLLGDMIANNGESYDIVVVGGFALIKYYNMEARARTRDIDFGYMTYYEDEDNTSLALYAQEITNQYSLDEHWINSDSGAHISPEIMNTVSYMESYGGINIYVPSAEALLAMKTVSARTKLEGHDYIDIPYLLEITGIPANISVLEANAQHYMPDEFSYRYDYATQGRLISILTEAGLMVYDGS